MRATRIIHDDTEKMIYFESARLEAFGVPLFYWPYLSTPDPDGQAQDRRARSEVRLHVGHAARSSRQPYFWALAPNYDLTLTPTLSSRQGLLMQAEWRHRLMNGSYSIKAAGIFQADPSAFENRFTPVYPGDQDPGDRLFRGSIDTTGQFALNNNWVWGWDGSLVTDRWSSRTTALRTYFAVMDPFKSGGLETVSQLYLTGRGERSYFDARVMYFYGLSRKRRAEPASDHPPGGRLSEQPRQSALRRRADATAANLISLSRENAEFDPITPEGLQHRPVRQPEPPIRRSRRRTIASCAASPAPIRAAQPKRRGAAR